MKRLLILLLAFNTFATAQPVRRATGWASTSGGIQYQVPVPISEWGHVTQGIIYVPQDKPLPNKKWPVILFFHGVGEAGTDPSRLLSQGLPAAIVKAEPYGILNKDTVKFIVLSLLDQYFSPPVAWFPYALEWLKRSYPIDTNYVYVTGLSAGGMNSFNTALLYPNKIAAAAPMSMSGYDAALTGTYKLPTWFFVGKDDTQYRGFTEGALKAINSPVEKLTMYPGAHCCWESQYTPELFTWFLANSKAPATPPVEPPARRVVSTITYYSDSTYSIKKE